MEQLQSKLAQQQKEIKCLRKKKPQASTSVSTAKDIAGASESTDSQDYSPESEEGAHSDVPIKSVVLYLPENSRYLVSMIPQYSLRIMMNTQHHTPPNQVHYCHWHSSPLIVVVVSPEHQNALWRHLRLGPPRLHYHQVLRAKAYLPNLIHIHYLLPHLAIITTKNVIHLTLILVAIALAHHLI
ncbi:hypothetical protein EW026_g6713 [Hermanssonia centrifuga]|uniref:Uncharacterized protein n=1 Tax=Hermanssonia centrifuga TaxID=98765 RepID=A0A4S4KA63_9APHY|nr:hypothetical protein EW026_g6713 [Hermanssonia centrifuga]